MKVNAFYILILFMAVALFFVTRTCFNGTAEHWVGVAHGREYKLSSEKRASVLSIRVVQGQEIKAGDTLMVLASEALLQEIDKLQAKIRTLQSEKTEKLKLVANDIALLNSAHAINVKQIENSIVQAETELRINRSLTGEQDAGAGKTQLSPLEEKIRSLREETALRNRELQIKVEDFKAKSSTDQSLLENQIRLLQNEFLLLEKEVKNLTKIAAANGVVEAVNVKEGEQVDAYVSLMSVLPGNPTSVIGYLPAEKAFPPIGTRVQVYSYDARGKTAEGKVIGYGAVTALPEILQKATAIKAFGKEVFIELPLGNDFSTGEKMHIRLWEQR
jgi:HlyD family secretion protein